MTDPFRCQFCGQPIWRDLTTGADRPWHATDLDADDPYECPETESGHAPRDLFADDRPEDSLPTEEMLANWNEHNDHADGSEW